MFNPRQPRDTGGQWVRIGRGELEQMIDALVQPRAGHIAEINGKPGTAHRKVVARDIKARVLKPVKVAPTYHVQIAENMNGHAVRIQAKGDSAIVKAVIPLKKHYGNVDVVAARGGVPPQADNIVNKAQFDATNKAKVPGKTELKAKGEEALRAAGVPTAVAKGSRVQRGLSEAAKGAQSALRKEKAAPDTKYGGAEHHKRLIEAAVAEKAVGKAQGDRLRAIITRYPPTEDLEPALYWDNINRRLLRNRAPKADRDAVAAMLAHEEGSGAGPVPGSRAGGGLPTGIEALLQFAPGDQRENLRNLFRGFPLNRGENNYAYVLRVRNDARVMLNANPGLLAALRKVRRGAQGDVRARAGLGAQGGRRQATVEPAKPQTLPKGDKWLHGKIVNVRDLGKRGGVNTTKKATIDGKLVFIKPVSGGYEKQIHAGIPKGKDPERERAAYLVGVAMGMDNIAPLVIRDVPGEGKASVQGGVGDGDAHVKGLPRGDQAKADRRSGALFDMVIGNMDRHQGNMRVSSQRIYPIDQGLAFAESDNNKGGWNNGFANDYWGRHLTDAERVVLENILVNDKLWNDVESEGLPKQAISRTKRRIKYMLRHQSFLKNGKQMGGNIAELENIA